ncbi:MAG: pyridoxamine 5'-phosphate oxidase [Gammaproteobacteria bacterium]
MNTDQIHSIHREYGNKSLSESDILSDPIAQFKTWLSEVLSTDYPDSTAMILATIDENAHPDSRVVLLKGLDHGFIFYTNYQSTKGKQIERIPFGALNFYWAWMARQVRIRGSIEKLTRSENEIYFSSRPRESQISSTVSPQSQVIESRRVLEASIKSFAESAPTEIPCPPYWGGYRLIPTELEFYQGRDARTSDRLRYIKSKDSWHIERLAP